MPITECEPEMEQPIAETDGRSFDGGCHCGAIRFRLQRPLRKILMCHCSDFMKITRKSWCASAADADNLHSLTEARLRWYRSSDWAERGFCSECGSQMFYRMDYRPLISIAPGAFDSSEMPIVAGQIFRSSHHGCGLIGGEIADLESR